MHRFRFCHSAHTGLILGIVILELGLASCQSGGPLSPGDPIIALSTTSLVFSNSNEHQVTITNLESAPVEWRVLSSTASWLTAAPTTGNLAANDRGTLTIRIDRRAVPAGTHSAALHIGASDGSIALRVSVQPETSARAALEPQSIALGSSGATGRFEVVNSGSATLNWTLVGPAWTTLAPSSGRLTPGSRAPILVTPVRSGLAAGQYTGILQLASDGGSATATLTMDVAGISGLRMEPSILDFGTSGAQQSLRVVNESDHAIEWRAQPGSNWISISSSSGTLPPHLSQLLAVDISRSGLSHGTNQSSILFTSSTGSTSAVVRATIVPAGSPNPSPLGPAKISVAPISLDYGLTATELTLRIHNEGDQLLEWAAQAEAPWIKLPTSAGHVAPHTNLPVTVRVLRTGLTPGIYQSGVRFTSSVGTVTATIVAVVGAPTPPPPAPPPTTPPKISVTPSSLGFGLTTGELSFRIQNTGGSPLNWTAGSNAGWATLPVSTSSLPPGAAEDVKVRVSRTGLTAGDYQSAIQLTSNGGSASIAISVQVPASPPPTTPAKVAVTPVSLSFGLTASELSFKIQNPGGSPLSWAAQSTTGWATLPVTTGSLPPGASEDVKVRVSRTGLAAGDYQSAIQLTSNGGSASIAVSVQVPISPPSTPPAKIAVTPISLGFGLTTGELSFRIQNSGGSSLNWTAQSTTSWATIAVSSGSLLPSAFQDVKVRVSRTGLTAGDYQSAIQLSSNGGSASIAVSLQVPTAPKIAVTPLSLSFGLTANELLFKIQNLGGSPLSWTAQSTTGWATLPLTTGSLPAGESQDVRVRVSRTGLTAGDYQSVIQLTSNGGSASVALALQVPVPPPSPPPSGGTGSTANVRDFGAKGDGIADDSPAFERAIEALPASGGIVLVPAGTYKMSAIHIGPYRPINLSRDNIAIIGDGMNNTVLKMAPAQFPTAANMILINKSTGITIKNLTIDMNVSTSGGGTLYADEQSHAIRLVSSTDTHIEGVRFLNSPGDGIYVLGLAETGDPWAERIWIENSQFVRSWRNGITIQRGVRQLQIRGNTFEEISQQSISSEPSGNNAPTDILIEDNVFRHWSQTSSYTIAMSGTRPSDNLRRLTFRRNRVENGSVYFLWMEDVQVSGNTLLGGPYKSVLRLHDVSHATITDNTISGIKQNESGVVQILNEDNQLSSDISLQNNRIDVAPGLTGVYVRDASGGISITGNEISGWGSGYGIMFSNLITSGFVRSGFQVTGNVVDNFATGIGFIVRGDGFTNVEVKSNAIDDQSPATGTTGVLFDGTGPYAAFAQVTSNTFGPGVTTPIRVR